MATGMVVSGTAMYFGTAVLLFASGLLFALLAVRESGYTRKMFLVGALPAVAMAVAYVFMGMEWVTVTVGDREQSVARFVGYSVVLGGAGYLIRELLDLSRRKFLTMTGLLLLTPWFALASWLPDSAAIESLFSVLTIAAYLAGSYYLFGPITRLAREVSGERQLVYAKLRNLFVLCWGALILQSAISEQTLGLTNLFVGQLGASYTDLIFMVGIGGLVVSGKEIFEMADSVDQQTHTESQTAAVSPSAGSDGD